MFGVYAAVLAAMAADPWPMSVGRLEKPIAVRLADGAPPLADVVRSPHPVEVAFVEHLSGEIAVRCGWDVRFRCFAVTTDGAVELCAGPGDAPCLDGSRLDIPRRVDVQPYRMKTEAPAECRTRLDGAIAEVHEGVRKILAGGGETILRSERAALSAPRMLDGCKGWYGTTGHAYNRSWCELKAAEHVGLLARVTGGTEGMEPVLNALIADCCVGEACAVTPWKDPQTVKPGP